MIFDEDEIRRRLALGGFSEEETNDLVERFRQEHDALEARKCRQCGGTLTRTIDPRQYGPKFKPGYWFNYRCSCGTMLDRVEDASPEELEELRRHEKAFHASVRVDDLVAMRPETRKLN